MAEAGIAAFGAAAGVAITMAIVLFALRGKGHPEQLSWDIQIKLQECSQTCHNPLPHCKCPYCGERDGCECASFKTYAVF